MAGFSEPLVALAASKGINMNAPVQVGCLPVPTR